MQQKKGPDRHYFKCSYMDSDFILLPYQFPIEAVACL